MLKSYQGNVYPDASIPRVKLEFSSDAECLMFEFDDWWMENTLERLAKSLSETEDFSLLVQRSTDDDTNIQPLPYVYVNKISCEIDYEAKKVSNYGFTGETLVQHSFTYDTEGYTSTRFSVQVQKYHVLVLHHFFRY